MNETALMEIHLVRRAEMKMNGNPGL